MSDSGKPPPWTVRLLRGSAYLFAAVILWDLTIALIREIWWMFFIAVLITVTVLALRCWYRRRNDWE